MDFSLDSYRMLARVAGIAHRTKDVATATESFATLWQRLDRENLADHCEARAAFNEAFARAYRGQPPMAAAPAPAPELPPNWAHNSKVRLSPAPAPRSVALDCAAFFNAKVGA